MPEIGIEISKIENKGLSKEDEAKEKDELYRDFSIKSERIHTINQPKPMLYLKKIFSM